jgi:SWI/SNF-related matrix-associated actin-dependent regulator of chromatin subfamily A member 5
MEEEGNDATGIKKNSSAYMHFSRMNTALIRDELLAEGKDASLGVLTQTTSARWHALSEDDKQPYKDAADKDKIRYLAECAERDKSAIAEQEERRAKNAVGAATESRMRGTTLSNSESLAMKESTKVRKPRVISDATLAERAEKKKAKDATEGSISSQKAEMKKRVAQQAESRLKFLLTQNDIFSHFAGQSKEEGGKGAKDDSANAPDTPTSRRSRGSSAALNEMDKDEQDLMDEEAEDSVTKKFPILTVQPRCIVYGKMRAYQLEGLNWMVRLQSNGINGILADEMGLGKTLQSISVLGHMLEFQQIRGPHLVVVPKSTLSNWVNEFGRWCPSLRVVRFHGSKDERAEMINSVIRPAARPSERNWDVCITTYEVCSAEKTALTKMAWRYLIIDEAHRLKNEASQFAQTVRQFLVQHRLLLTGTPLQNNLHEMWALLNFLLPDIFASSEQFDEWFNLDVDDVEAKQRMISQLHKLLRPFMLRRLKADVEKGLPPKSETILFCGLSASQKNLYKQILLRDIDAVNGAGSGSAARTTVLNIVMQLRKCCNHPYLFPGIEDRTLDPLGDHLWETCGKMQLLHKLLVKMQSLGHRVLIFSQMTKMLDIMEDFLISKQYQYCRIDGNTNYEDREDRIASYNAPNSEKFIFLLSTRAGGLGINLQTADTVILYDSDWNPQADLQAQDRAHRIGQKKPVQVFRLVTDETVEVKVVERAQQKLKLDAMVVQQGRLQEQEKKMSKDDLLDTLRFGADKIFRSKDATISDADIDLILEEGKKKTAEMMGQMEKAEKGDMYDFKLDGGMATQVFEGTDYSNKNLRENGKDGLAQFGGVGFFIDPGKRERKTVASYSDTMQKMIDEAAADKRPKMPRHLRLPKLEDWQFFNRTRLTELQSQEIELFEKMVETGWTAPPGQITKVVILAPAEHEEKTRLLSDGFGSWTKVHFNNFIRASAKYGRKNYSRISKDTGFPSEEVERYATSFWSRGHEFLAAVDWDRYTKQIEKGEKKLEEISRLTDATEKLIGLFENPWEELTFRHVGNQGRIFNALEDRYLLCLTQLHGYGAWDRVRNSIRRCDLFRFDYFIQSCSAEAVGKRCETLMRAAERELIEIEKKESKGKSSKNSGGGFLDAFDANKAKLSSLNKQINDEARKLAIAREAMKQMEQKPGKAVVIEGNSGEAGEKSVSDAKAIPKAGEKKSSVGKSKASGATDSGNAVKIPKEKKAKVTSNTVPEELLPELCRSIVNCGQGTIQTAIDSFASVHADVISKRQLDLRIKEMSFKEKSETAGTNHKVWQLKPEYEKYLGMPVAAATSPSDPSPTAKKRKAPTEPSSPVSTTKSSKKEEGASTTTSTEPKKPKSAFGWFVKHNREQVEAKAGITKEEMKAELTRMWDSLDVEGKSSYEDKAKQDRARYLREKGQQ